MKKRHRLLAGLPAVVIFIFAGHKCLAAETALPKPSLQGAVSLEETLAGRRSVRSYTVAPLALSQVSQLLWSAQGITSAGGKRTAPSAGAIYPLDLYLVAGNVSGLAAGVYRYSPAKNALIDVLKGDLRAKLAQAALGQPWVKAAPATVVFAVNYGKMGRYSAKGKMFADFEVGHAAENLMLQAVALGLGTVAVGAISENIVQSVLKIPTSYVPVYLVPVGHPG